MTYSLNEFRQQAHIDHGSVEAEWKVIQSYIDKDPEQSGTLLHYVFTQYQGYVDNRVRAGLMMYEAAASEVWNILEQLVHSKDPDDRDTALQTLKLIKDERRPQIALPLLNDRYPYIALDAVDYIWDTYPTKVRATLERLSTDVEKWTAEAAKDRLARLSA